MSPKEQQDTSTLQLMESLVTSTFGTLTIDSSKWPSENKRLPKRSFFSDRKRNNGDKPINRKCAQHILALYEMALTERTAFDRFFVSEKLASTLSAVAGTSLHMHELTNGDSRDAQKEKSALQLEQLSIMLELAINAEYIYQDDYRGALSSKPELLAPVSPGQTASTARRRKSFNDEIRFIPDSVNEAGYRKLILQTEHELGISHFHGTQWTKANLEALRERFSYGNLHVRVVLADKNSPFLEPYAILKNTSVSESWRAVNMRDKIDEAVAIWISLFDKAKASGASNLSLEIFQHTLVPAMATYIFDRTLIITPTKNSTKSKTFPAFRINDIGGEGNAFRAFMDEFDSLASQHSLVAARGTEKPEATKRGSQDLLEKILEAMFGSTVVNYKNWNTTSLEQHKPRSFFSERLSANVCPPIDNETAEYLYQTIEIALDGRANQKAETVSKRILAFLLLEYGIDARACAFSSEDSAIKRECKRRQLLDVLHFIIFAATNTETFALDDVNSMIAWSHR